MHEREVAQLLIDLFSPEYDAEERCSMLENAFPVIVERPNEAEVFRNTASLIFRFDDVDAAIAALQERGVNVIGGVELYSRNPA